MVIAESANGRWGTDWAQVEWANSATAETGLVVFDPITNRRTQAWAAAALAIVLLVGSAVARRLP